MTLHHRPFEIKKKITIPLGIIEQLLFYAWNNYTESACGLCTVCMCLSMSSGGIAKEGGAIHNNVTTFLVDTLDLTSSPLVSQAIFS